MRLSCKIRLTRTAPRPRATARPASGWASARGTREDQVSMPLPHDYAIQQCSLARALEVVGERWTLLIVRDAFFGVRRFGDFAHHLRIPRAVLAQRLETLVAHGV